MIREIFSCPPGTDMYGALQGVFGQCSNGDTIKLTPVNGWPFVFSKQLNWVGKNINLSAVGATLYAQFTGPALIFGASVGSRGASVRWLGGNLGACPLVIQNMSYSVFELDACQGLELRADTVTSYNDFRINAMNNQTTAGACIFFNYTAPGAWMNQNRFYKCTMGIPGTGGTVIAVKSLDGAGPGLLFFDVCDFEGTAQMFNCGLIGPVFRDCYWEGTFTLGTISTPASVLLNQPWGGNWWVGTPVVSRGGINPQN